LDNSKRWPIDSGADLQSYLNWFKPAMLLSEVEAAHDEGFTVPGGD
jgi:hypothetical protein